MFHGKCLVITALAAIILASGANTSGAAIGDIEFSFTNLPTLDPAVDGVYEGWAIIGGMPVSTGIFNVDAMGNPVDPVSGNPIPLFNAGSDLTTATSIKISIEPPMDPDPAPSGLIVLSGTTMGGMSDMSAALPDLSMLASATGSYILATPSDDSVDTMNGNQGIWYLSMPGPAAGLVGLPSLGSSWTYEGWIVDISSGSPMPYSTGTFDSAAMTDSDAAGCNGGGPPFPGQDLTAFHCGPIFDLDSGDFVAVISIEPVPDNGPGPFLFKPLAGMIPTDALTMGGALGNQTNATFPTGTASFGEALPAEDLGWSELKNMYR